MSRAKGHKSHNLAVRLSISFSSSAMNENFKYRPLKVRTHAPKAKQVIERRKTPIFVDLHDSL